MATNRLDTALWQQNLATLIRSGLFTRAKVGQARGLFTVVGIYTDGTQSAPLAKFSDRDRARDAAAITNRLAGVHFHDQDPADLNDPQAAAIPVPS
jgi:hypothetical protein